MRRAGMLIARPLSPLNDDVQIRPYRAGDEQRILDTFNAVFREVNGRGFVDRTMAQWEWQYLRNPVGHRITLAIAPDGTVASQYAGVPLLADTPWGPQRFVQCVDSMTHPRWRQGFQPPLFVRAGNRYLEQCTVVGEAMCYGLPVDTAFRIGKALFGYEELRSLDYSIRDRATAPLPAPRDVACDRATALPLDVDALWAAVRADKQCLVRRDARYLQWRYVDNPDHDAYELWTARRGARLTGLMVLRRDCALVPDSMVIADWLVPDADGVTANALLAAAFLRQHELQRRSLLAVFAPWSAESRLLHAHGFSSTPSARWLERRLVHHTHLASLTPAFLASSWWYTLGDTDLV